ncbi:hypothetical protein Ddc_16637 [Ditylenchus destructor]|nr:hypothetical protein Ddc_16637 [Ditylenchus destructor]
MDEKMDDKGDGAQLRKSLPAKLTNEPKNAPNSSSISSKSKIQKAKCVICSKSNKTKLPYCNACHKFAERVKQRDNSLGLIIADHADIESLSNWTIILRRDTIQVNIVGCVHWFSNIGTWL